MTPLLFNPPAPLKSQLGYGCSALMGRLSRRESRRLLDCAFDHGIRHFDVARSYGYGEAEGVVGEFLRSRREQVSITTKVGLVPPVGGGIFRLARGVARKIVEYAPSLRTHFRRGAGAMVRSANFSPAFIRRTLETSLHELKTERVDILLLHECDANDLAIPGVIDTLCTLRAEGLIGNYGVGSDVTKTREIMAQGSSGLPVIQFENNPMERSLLPLCSAELLITHRALGGVLNQVARALDRNPGARKMWSRRIGVDPGERNELVPIFLLYALTKNATGGVLFSSTNPNRIVANAVLADRATPLSDQQCVLIEELADWAVTTHHAN
jgi:D-threo-aldose 1-dehydrogenase